MEIRGSSIAVSAIRWDLFGTLTWAGKVPCHAASIDKLGLFMKWVARAANVQEDKLVWAAREELGELGGRAHWHPIIMFPDKRNSRVALAFFEAPPKCRSVAQRRWPFGMSKFRRILGCDDPAVQYIEKGSGSSPQTYEMVKTGRGHEVVLSDGLVRLLQALHEDGRLQDEPMPVGHTGQQLNGVA